MWLSSDSRSYTHSTAHWRCRDTTTRRERERERERERTKREREGKPRTLLARIFRTATAQRKSSELQTSNWSATQCDGLVLWFCINKTITQPIAHAGFCTGYGWGNNLENEQIFITSYQPWRLGGKMVIHIVRIVVL